MALVLAAVATSAPRAQSASSATELTAILVPAPDPAGSPSADERGIVVLSLRGSQAPRDVTVWSSQSGVSFVDVAPLVGLFDGIDSAAGLHARMAASADPNTPDARWGLLTAAMRTLDIDTADALWQRYQRERSVLDHLVVTDRLGPTLIALGKELATMPERRPWIRTSVVPGGEPRVVGYLVNRAAADSGPLRLLAGFDGALPEQLVGPAKSAPGPGFLKRVRDTLADTVGVVVGAAIGFLVFLGQQRYTRANEIEKQFATKKVELSKSLRAFFAPNGNYETLRDAGDSPKARVRSLRDTLIDEGIYAILPIAEARSLDALCKRDAPDTPMLVTEFDALIRRRFGEFVQ